MSSSVTTTSASGTRQEVTNSTLASGAQPSRAQTLLEFTLPAGALLVLLVWWISANGGFSPTVWSPSSLLALALASWLFFLGPGRLLPPSRAAAQALIVFAALVALNYLSVLWADSAGSALDAANKLGLDLVVAWIAATLPWTPRRLAAALALWSTAVAVLCGLALLQAVAPSADLSAFFVDGRFSRPMLYSNATGALVVMGMWPALLLSSRREVAPWLRAVLLAQATFLGAYAVLPQSRGALLGLVVTVPVALVLSRARVRLLLRVLMVAAAVAVQVPRALAVGRAVSAGRGVHVALASAGMTMLVAAAAAALAGLVLAGLENRWDHGHPAQQMTPRLSVRQRRWSALGAGALVLIAIAAATPTIVTTVQTAIRNGNSDASVGANRLTSISPEERFDYARVSLDIFTAHPVLGVGAGNFGRQYDAQRRFLKHSAYTHDLLLRVLSETGVVGLILFIALLASLAWGLLAILRRDTLARSCVAITATLGVFFLCHASLDWLDQFPALAVPALGFMLAALALGPARALPAAHQGAARRRWLGRLPGVLAGAVLLLAFASGYLGQSYLNRAFVIFRGQPAAAFADLRTAHTIDPLSADPATSEGTIALYLGDQARAAGAFRRSLATEDAWYPRLELALIYAHEGRFSTAAAQLNAARALDASDPAIEQAQRLVAAHQTIDPIAFNQTVAQEGNVGADQGSLR